MNDVFALFKKLKSDVKYVQFDGPPPVENGVRPEEPPEVQSPSQAEPPPKPLRRLADIFGRLNAGAKGEAAGPLLVDRRANADRRQSGRDRPDRPDRRKQP